MSPLDDILLRPYAAALPPLFAGEKLLQEERPDGTPVTVIRQGDRHKVRIGAGASRLCYVIEGIDDVRDAMELARTMPAPNAATTHTTLSAVARDAEHGFVVRVESGERCGSQAGTKVLLEVEGRVNQMSFHRAADYGLPEAEIPILAFDLRLFAKVFDEGWHFDEMFGGRSGEMRSLWIGDFSDELETRRADYVLVRRQRADGRPAPKGSGSHRAAGTIEDPVHCRPDLHPVHGPIEALLTVDVSPPADVNFRYVTEADPDRRAALRREIMREAVARADREIRIDFAPSGPKLPLSFEEFLRTAREYRYTDRPNSPYPDPDGVSTWARAYAESDGAHDGLLVRQEFYKLPDKYRTLASRFHIEAGGRKYTLVSPDLAAAIVYLRAQADGDPRVARSRRNLSYEALAANGEHHGRGWSSFAFPDLPNAYFRIEQTEAGFSSEFSGDERFPSMEQALEAAYATFMEAILEDAPTPAPG